MVCNLPVGCNSDLSNIERAPIAFRKPKDYINISFFDGLSDFIHFWGVKRHRVCLILLEYNLSVDEIVSPWSPGIAFGTLIRLSFSKISTGILFTRNKDFWETDDLGSFGSGLVNDSDSLFDPALKVKPYTVSMSMDKTK